MSKLARTTRPRRLLAAGAAIVGLAAVTTVAVAALQPGPGIRSARGDAKTTLPSKPDIASFDLVMTTVRRSGTKLVFSEQVSGKAGAWQAAHEIVQTESSDLAGWLHGIVHTLEGDLDNARYWYRRVGRPFPGADAVREEIAAARRALDV